MFLWSFKLFSRVKIVTILYCSFSQNEFKTPLILTFLQQYCNILCQRRHALRAGLANILRGEIQSPLLGIADFLFQQIQKPINHHCNHAQNHNTQDDHV